MKLVSNHSIDDRFNHLISRHPLITQAMKSELVQNDTVYCDLSKKYYQNQYNEDEIIKNIRT